MTAYQVYEQAIKPLATEEKLLIVRLIMDEVVPDVGLQTGMKQNLTPVRSPRQFGAGRHLLSGVGIDVDELLAVPIDETFADYMPEEH